MVRPCPTSPADGGTFPLLRLRGRRSVPQLPCDECAISAFFAGNGLAVPTDHARRFALYERLRGTTTPSAAPEFNLDILTVRSRNDSLYFDERTGRLPTDRFGADLIGQLLPLVHRFAREIWAEIR